MSTYFQINLLLLVCAAGLALLAAISRKFALPVARLSRLILILSLTAPVVLNFLPSQALPTMPNFRFSIHRPLPESKKQGQPVLEKMESQNILMSDRHVAKSRFISNPKALALGCAF